MCHHGMAQTFSNRGGRQIPESWDLNGSDLIHTYFQEQSVRAVVYRVLRTEYIGQILELINPELSFTLDPNGEVGQYLRRGKLDSK